MKVKITNWDIVIGLEIHVQLNTNTKAFCNDRNLFGDTANTHISPITLAHPGTLPRMNKEHIVSSLKLGLAFGSVINKENSFDRKNYFYPDLPKGYQITQDESPICVGGKCEFIMGDGSIRSIRIHHVHMEEDAGKSIHDIDPRYTLLDYNRAGVPLVEIVTEPDFRSSEEVFYFIASLQQLVRHLGISDGNMEEGSFRCDCNVSVKPKNRNELGQRCEIKNLNSKRFAKAAIEYEAIRQIKILESGGAISKTTMLYDSHKGITYPMRDKEDVNDYRYFNDPDLPPIEIDTSLINYLKEAHKTLPVQSYRSLIEEFSIQHDNAMIIIDDSRFLNLFYNLVDEGSSPKDVALIIINKIAPNVSKYSELLEGNKFFVLKVKQFLDLIESGKVSKSAAYNSLFDNIWDNLKLSLEELAQKLEILQVDDQSFITDLVTEVLNKNPNKVEEYQKGKKGLIGFFMGQAMKISKGKADPKVLQSEFESRLLS